MDPHLVLLFEGLRVFPLDKSLFFDFTPAPSPLHGSFLSDFWTRGELPCIWLMPLHCKRLCVRSENWRSGLSLVLHSFFPVPAFYFFNFKAAISFVLVFTIQLGVLGVDLCDLPLLTRPSASCWDLTVFYVSLIAREKKVHASWTFFPHS